MLLTATLINEVVLKYFWAQISTSSISSIDLHFCIISKSEWVSHLSVENFDYLGIVGLKSDHRCSESSAQGH